MSRHAVIAGGGIGGLTAALAFAVRGWRVSVLEQAPAFTEIGAGVQLSPNGMKVLAALGVADAVVDCGFRPQALELRLGRSGRPVFRVGLGAHSEARWGAPYVHAHRADLIDVLRARLAAAPGVQLRTGARVTGYRTGDTGAAALLADGTAVQGDVVTGADGIHSELRAQMLGPDAPRYTGFTAWRAVVPIDRLGAHAPPPTACVWAGEGRHAVTYRLRGGRLTNLVGVVTRPAPPGESWVAEGTKAEALSDFAGFHDIVRTLIERADRHFRWALHDRAPLERWTDGRVALLGDACHPTLPFMAQGAVMAIEDAYVLARVCAEGGDDLPAALLRYQAQRRERTAMVQAASRANAGTFHRTGGLSRLIAYGPMWLAGRLAPQAVRARFDRFYLADVTD